MNYLLDTHTVLWALTNPARLGPEARGVLESGASEIVVSAVTAWEIATKHRLGKLPQADVLIAAYPSHIAKLQAQQLPITQEHALAAGRLNWSHRDPFDRILVAQAMLESMTLLTNDTVITAMPGIRAVW